MFIVHNVQVIMPDEERLQLEYSTDQNSLINDNNEPITINVQELFTSVKFLFQSS